MGSINKAAELQISREMSARSIPLTSEETTENLTMGSILANIAGRPATQIKIGAEWIQKNKQYAILQTISEKVMSCFMLNENFFFWM